MAPAPVNNPRGMPMSKDPAKDFGPIADDYVFFETHATEPAEDARAYVEQLAGVVPAEGPIRLLDFGCGSGTFSLRFLHQVGWPSSRLRLTLVEPVESVRRLAVGRLAACSDHPVVDWPALPGGTKDGFDVVLANHVFYYVPALPTQLAALVDAMTPQGIFVTAIAARTNALVEFWLAGFRLLGREAPYNTSEDVEAALQQSGAAYQKQAVPYRLEFPDTEANRMRILRFLLAEHLGQMPHRPLLEMFDQYASSGRITMQTASDHYTIRPK
jgi:trans-aconitate 2-methyltransferase